MAKEVKFSLVFRDMWQSAGKYQPRVDQLVKVAPAIIKMGCFDRVETNGGGFEQVNLLYGENPNKSVREWTKPFHEAGIQTHMLDRALNALRMSPVPKDVRKLFYKVKKAQGTDITRIFCGLNDPRNVIPSIQYAKEAGMIAQASLCITYSPIHTVEYYVDLAKKFIDAGADEICLKDMAGIGRPVSLGKIVAGIKNLKKDIVIQYHSHAGPGFNMASILEVCNAGCDYIDTGMSPLSWGTGHADIIAVQEMLKDAGFKVKEINMAAYMEVRTQIQEMCDDFLGYYIPDLNHIVEGEERSARTDYRRPAHQALRRSGLRMAKGGLSLLGDSILPVCEEPRPDERDADGKGQAALEHDCRHHLGHDSRQGRSVAWSCGS